MLTSPSHSCTFKETLSLLTTGSHSGPSSEKQSPMIQKHSPQTQPSLVAQPGQGGTHPGQVVLQPSQTAAQPGQVLSQPGQTPAQTNQIVSGPPPAAAQPAPAGTQQSPVSQPSGLPPQLYLHDGRWVSPWDGRDKKLQRFCTTFHLAT